MYDIYNIYYMYNMYNTYMYIYTYIYIYMYIYIYQGWWIKGIGPPKIEHLKFLLLCYFILLS